MKISSEELKQLREAYRGNELAEARLKVARSQLDYIAVDLFQRHGLRQGRLAICLDCGGFFDRGAACDCGDAGD